VNFLIFFHIYPKLIIYENKYLIFDLKQTRQN
jgi:hypothetical protein